MDIFIRNIREKIMEAIRDRDHAAGTGVCSDFSTYREMVGERNGLDTALEIIKAELIKLHEEDDEDAA